MYKHTYIHTCIHTYIQTNIHTYIHTCMHACMHACRHAHIHTCIHTYIRTYVRTYARTYVHTYSVAAVSSSDSGSRVLPPLPVQLAFPKGQFSDQSSSPSIFHLSQPYLPNTIYLNSNTLTTLSFTQPSPAKTPLHSMILKRIYSLFTPGSLTMAWH